MHNCHYDKSGELHDEIIKAPLEFFLRIMWDTICKTLLNIKLLMIIFGVDVEVSCLLNSVLHIVPQSLALSNSFIHVFGWTSFPYPTALETSDATCPYSLECPLHRSVTWHRPLKNWLQIPWAAGFPHRLLRGSWKPASLEGLLAWCWGGAKGFWGIAKFNFSKSGTSADTSIYSQRRNLILSCHWNPLGPSVGWEPFTFQTLKWLSAPKLRGVRQTHGL